MVIDCEQVEGWCSRPETIFQGNKILITRLPLKTPKNETFLRSYVPLLPEIISCVLPPPQPGHNVRILQHVLCLCTNSTVTLAIQWPRPG